MPIIKKLNLTPAQLQILNAAQNGEKVFLSPREKFQHFAKLHYKKSKTKLRKFHFKGVEFGDKIYLYNGIGKECGVFENGLDGMKKCRVFALFELFLKTPEEKRQGGYKIDFCE